MSINGTMTKEEKEWIDKASYRELIHKWRYEPTMSGYFAGERGEYFAKVLKEKGAGCDHVAASKDIGWE